MTKSSCTVNNTTSNTCTIRQTTSTFNNCKPASTILLNESSNLASPSTGFASSIVTTTTTHGLNSNQRKVNELEQQNKNLAKPNLITNDVYRNANSSNNFVRGIFRSCNVNFTGPNFKSQKYSQKYLASTKTPGVTTLNNSLNTTIGLTKLTAANRTINGELEPPPPTFNRASLRAEALGKNSKLISKAIQQNGFLLKQVKNQATTNKNDHKSNDVTTSNFNYLTNSVSSPSLNSSESDEDDEEEETELQTRLTSSNSKATVKQTSKSSSNKLIATNRLLHNSNNTNFKTMAIYPSSCPLQRSKTLMLNSNGKPELNAVRNRPKHIEITTTHHYPNANCPENRSLSSPVSTVSTKSVWYEYGCV